MWGTLRQVRAATVSIREAPGLRTRSEPLPAVASVRALLLALVLLAFALRVYRLEAQNLWFDEGLSIHSVLLSTSAWWQERYRAEGAHPQSVHPPLYTLLLRLWAAPVGLDPFALRYPSVLAGVLSVPLLARLGVRLFGPGVGLVAAALLALSPFAVHHSQEVRMYTLLPMVTLLSWNWFLTPLSEAPSRPRSFPWPYAASLATAGALHYAAALLPISQGAFLLGHPRRRALFPAWSRALALVAVLSALWFVPLLPGLLHSLADKTAAESYVPVPLPAYLWLYLRVALFGYGNGTPIALTGGVAFIVAVIAFGSLVGLLRREGRWTLLGLLGAVVAPLLVAFLGNYVVPFDEFPRLLASIHPILLLLVAVAAQQLFKGLVSFVPWASFLSGSGAIALLALWTPFLWEHYTVPRWLDLDYRGLAARINELFLPGDVILCDLPWQAGLIASYAPPLRDALVVLPPFRSPQSDLARQAKLQEVAPQAKRIWYPSYEHLGGTEMYGVRPVLRSWTQELLGEWYGETRLFLYNLRRPADLLPATRTDISLDRDHVRLVGFTVPRTAYHQGEAVSLLLFWQATERLPAYVRIVRLEDAQGRPLVEKSGTPDQGQRPTASWVPGELVPDEEMLSLPADLPPGAYRLSVELYDPGLGAGLRPSPSAPAELPLAVITVAEGPAVPR
jgi:mannosyltransferase